MVFFITRTNAIRRLKIGNKIFDWLCFLNKICVFSPRKKIKNKKVVYFILNQIKEMQKSNIFNKIIQIHKWKNVTRKLVQSKTYDKFFSFFRSVPFYNLNLTIKKTFFSLTKILKEFSNLVFFILILASDFERIRSHSQTTKKFQIYKKSFFFFTSFFKNNKMYFRDR